MHICRSRSILDERPSYLALNKGTHAAFLVSDNLDIYDIGMLREVLREQPGKLFLVEIRG